MHALDAPPAFVLSQDQTLKIKNGFTDRVLREPSPLTFATWFPFTIQMLMYKSLFITQQNGEISPAINQSIHRYVKDSE